MITIESYSLGAPKSARTEFFIPLPPLEENHDEHNWTLRDLITQVVREEVAREQRNVDEGHSPRVLTRGELVKGLEQGQLRSGGGRRYDIAVEEEIVRALGAFEMGHYLVIVDGQEVCDLEERVAVSAGTHVTFVRLAQLFEFWEPNDTSDNER